MLLYLQRPNLLIIVPLSLPTGPHTSDDTENNGEKHKEIEYQERPQHGLWLFRWDERRRCFIVVGGFFLCLVRNIPLCHT